MVKVYSILFITLFALPMAKQKTVRTHASKPVIDTSVIDGPYVLYRGDSVFVNYIEEREGNKSVKGEGMQVSAKNNITLTVKTDEPGKTFSVKLKPSLTNEKPEYDKVKKMLVVSDIEGNFTALRKLLQASHVIDDSLNWTFEKNHLVLIGDFVDRGTMVMEVLWFIYGLEEKAKAAGGYVHYILGNHEIMNMSNDLRYVNERYMQHAALMNKEYMQLFGPDAEIGRWLATKNIVERIGNILFTHGGFSQYMNNISISLKDLNNIARPLYTDTMYDSKDDRVNIIYSDLGPFWYRGYYAAPKASMAQIDSTLNIYDVRYITTGHTIVANEIRSFYDGKLFDTDVHHADGHSEALLIDNGKFWRVNAAGEKMAVQPLQ